MTNISNISGTRKYSRRSQSSGRNWKGAVQTKFKSHVVWHALRKLLKRTIYTRSERQLGPERQLPCMQWPIKLRVSTKVYWLQNLPAKKGLTIPKLKLVSAHMAANLNGLEGQPVRLVHGWLDSTVALHWVRVEGSVYKQSVANRVKKIRDKAYTQWRHVGSDQNPADIGSRGCQADKLSELCFKGPEWLTESEAPDRA